MTEAGTPGLNKPVDRSEYQRRCEEALKVAKAEAYELRVTLYGEPDAVYERAQKALANIKRILEDR